jgi:hypothetical protein
MVSMSLRLQCMVLECQSCHGSASLRRPFLQVFLWEELRQSTSDHGPAPILRRLKPLLLGLGRSSSEAMVQ